VNHSADVSVFLSFQKHGHITFMTLHLLSNNEAKWNVRNFLQSIS